jgi:KaiC/GvpD/RAD55 family RecA-like ATPase
MTGTDLSVALSSTGRKLLGEFIYPLTGVTSIPSSTWTVYYRGWLANLTEYVSVNSPSSVPHVWWDNAEYAYSSDDNYANASNPVRQEYGGYGFNLPPTANITKVEVGYEAYTSGDEKIGIALSVDGGIQWTAQCVTPSLGTTDQDMVGWIDFTTAANWTASMFSDSNFSTRVQIIKVGVQIDNVFLDWLPVRITYAASSPSAHADIDILVRRSDGTIRQTLAVSVANSEPLAKNVQTLSGTYNWPGYAVVNETDYLEIDYYMDVLSVDLEAIGCLRIDDATSVIADQTRVANIMLPSEYTAEVELSGYSDLEDWSKIVWTIDSSWTTENVSLTLQLYDYVQGIYPTSGDGYIAFTSSPFANTDETKTQAITANTTNFRDSAGNWKMRIKSVKQVNSQFSLGIDLSTYQVTHLLHRDIAVLGITYSPAAIYPTDILSVNVTVKNAGEMSESFNVTLYCDENQIGKQAVTNLMPNESIVLVFDWNTTGTTVGVHTLKTVADTVPNENETANNIFTDDLVRVKGQPVAFFMNAPESPVAKELVTFNASLSVSDGSFITSYEWDFGDGNTTITSYFTITHVYANVGNYTVILNVTNNDGLWDANSKIIAVKSQVESGLSSPPWNWSLALLSAPFIIMFFAAIVMKKRKNKSKSVGLEFLNKITDGGIPDSFSVMLVGGADSGKSVLFQELAYMFLKMEKPCIYVVYECFPDEIEESMKKFHWNTSTYKNQGKLSYIDCFSSTAKVQSKEKYSLNQPFSLIDLGITISKATNDAGNTAKVFLDSIVPLLTQLDPARVVDFLQDRIARVKGIKGNLIFTLSKESVDPALMSRLEEIVDCIIELDANQIKGKLVRKLRIKKMRGRNSSDKWVRFEISPEKGLIFPI